MYTYQEFKEIVNRAILNIPVDMNDEALYDPVRYILSAGGKRLRPVMTLMSCNLFTDNIEPAVIPAAGMEIFHNFTLVHDDIMDNADMRRGIPTVHVKWNLSQAILSGDVMVFLANECIMHVPSERLKAALKTYNRAAREVCEGQQMDMDFELRELVSLDEYLRMIELKTSVLIAASLKLGAIVAGAKDDQADCLYEFGRNLGLAFQLKDDLLDTYGDPEVFGKKIGGDIRANKKTALLIKAFELASGDDLTDLRTLVSGKNTNDEVKIPRVKALYDKLGVKQLAEDLASDYTSAAFSKLEELDVSSEKKEPLQELANELLGRSS